MPHRSQHFMGLILVILADLLWSTVFVASQTGLDYTNPYVLVFLRFLISTIVIVAMAIPFGSTWGIIGALKKWWTWGLGAIYAFGFLFQYIGQDLTSASDATLLSNLSPILIPFLAVILLRERLTAFHILATAISFIGLYLVAGFNPSGDLVSTVGYILLILTSLSYALFTVLSKKHEVASLGSTLAIIIAITAILAPFAFTLGGLGSDPLLLPAEAWASILYLAIPCTLVAIVVYIRGLAAISASEAAFLFLLQIIVGLALSFMILGEMLGPYQMIGAALIVVGLFTGMMANERRLKGNAIKQQ